MEDVLARIKLTPNSPHLRSPKFYFTALVSIDKKANLATSGEKAKVLLGIHDHRQEREIASKSTNYLKFDRDAVQDIMGATKKHAANFRLKQFETFQQDHGIKAAFADFEQYAHIDKQQTAMVDILGKFASAALDHVNVIHVDFLHDQDTNKIRTPLHLLQDRPTDIPQLTAQVVDNKQLRRADDSAPPKGFDLFFNKSKAPECLYGVSLTLALKAHHTFYNQKVQGARVRNNSWFAWKAHIQKGDCKVVQDPSNAYIRRICLASQVAQNTQVAQLTFKQPIIQVYFPIAFEIVYFCL